MSSVFPLTDDLRDFNPDWLATLTPEQIKYLRDTLIFRQKLRDDSREYLKRSLARYAERHGFDKPEEFVSNLGVN